MKRIAILLSFVLLATQSLFAQERKITVGQVELVGNDSVVFLGDSITHQCLYTQYIEDFFITRFPDVEIKFHNAGIGGDKAWDALQRLDRDVLSKKPKLVTILLGMNDGRYQAFDHEIFETYRTDMSTLLDRLQDATTTVSPITPTMFDSVAARADLKRRPREESTLQQYNAVLAYFGTWLRGEADRRAMQSIDMFSPLNQLTRLARRENAEYTFIKDAIHPGEGGQLIMAHAWLENLGLQSGVSNLVFTPTAKGSFRGRAVNGTISELSGDADRLEFTFLANSLPWVVSEGASDAAKMLKLDHKFSREGFQVHGLPAGKYRLSIDGIEIGVFNQSQLASHIELQRYPSTPQSVQATKVLAMNRARNETAVRPMRNHWFTFRNLMRHKRSLPLTTDAAAKSKLEKQIEKAKSKMEGFEETLVKLETEAAQQLDAIYAAAKPKPHRYVLERVE